MSAELLKRTPEILHPYWDDTARDAHEKLTAQNTQQIMASMPPMQAPETEAHAGYVLLESKEVADRRHAIVLPLPFANGWDPHMAIRAKLLADSLPVPQRVVVFPNNSKVVSSTAYTLADREARRVRSGDFAPRAAQQLETLKDLGIESFQVVGYSGGASVGAAALKLAGERASHAVGASGLFEAPNVMNRSGLGLQKAFAGDGTSGFNQAVRESQIPALTEAQKAKGGVKAALAQAVKFGLFFVSSVARTENRIDKAGFGKDTFSATLAGALRTNKNLQVLVAAGENSRIMTPEVLRVLTPRLRDEGVDQNLQVLSVPGYGHEMGDNLILHTALARAALDGARVA